MGLTCSKCSVCRGLNKYEKRVFKVQVLTAYEQNFQPQTTHIHASALLFSGLGVGGSWYRDADEFFISQVCPPFRRRICLK